MLHVFLNYLLISVFGLELVGCAVATFVTYSFIFLVNCAKLKGQSDIKQALEVKLFSKQVRNNLWDYVCVGLPGMFTLIIEFISYEITVIFMGQIGVKYQATQILLLNFFAIPLMMAFGYQ